MRMARLLLSQLRHTLILILVLILILILILVLILVLDLILATLPSRGWVGGKRISLRIKQLRDALKSERRKREREREGGEGGREEGYPLFILLVGSARDSCAR